MLAPFRRPGGEKIDKKTMLEKGMPPKTKQHDLGLASGSPGPPGRGPTIKEQQRKMTLAMALGTEFLGWLLVVRCSLLVVGCWLLVVRCSLLVILSASRSPPGLHSATIRP